MNKILTLTIALLIGYTATAQQKMSCCVAASSTKDFAAMATDMDFQKAHIDPLPYVYDEELGRSITFKCSDGKKANAFEILSNYDTDKYLFVFHEWWGLNDYMKREAAKLFKDLKIVNVIVIDLYDGAVATTKEDAGKMMAALKEERAKAIIQGAIKLTGKKATIATIGWCMGGGWSLQASMMAGAQGVGCVMYYGMPEKDVEKLKTMDADVLGIFAAKDKWITPELVQQFQKDMETAGKALTVSNFDNDHAFANPSNPGYDKEATLKAYKQALSFLKLHLGSVKRK